MSTHPNRMSQSAQAGVPDGAENVASATATGDVCGELATGGEREALARRIRELGEWFHNMNLRGEWTAPGHFLGDFPNVKWKHIAPAIPADLAGQRPRHRLQWRLLLDSDETARRRTRARHRCR